MKRALAVLVSVLLSAPVLGQTIEPVGGEFQVNTTRPGYQRWQSASMDVAGNFVVVWCGPGAASATSVLGQRYAADGAPLGGEFRINSYDDSCLVPGVAMGERGEFVVVWMSDASSGTDTDGSSILGRRYAADGTPLTGEFQVNSETTANQWSPAVGIDGAGNSVVVWSTADGDDLGVHGQRFDPGGVPLGGEFQVNVHTPRQQFFATVTVAENGAFIVAWNSEWQFGADEDVVARRYDSGGAPLSGEFQVNTYTSDRELRPAVAIDDDGSFVVAWSSGWYELGIPGSGPDGDKEGVYAQRFDSGGVPLGGEFQVNTTTVERQRYPAVAFDPGGGFLVVWQSGNYEAVGEPGEIIGQQFAADGTAVGGEFQVNTYSTGYQFYSEIAANARGDFVVAWTSFGSATGDSDGSVQAQRFTAPLFVDGFESGDLSAWSEAVPPLP